MQWNFIFLHEQSCHKKHYTRTKNKNLEAVLERVLSKVAAFFVQHTSLQIKINSSAMGDLIIECNTLISLAFVVEYFHNLNAKASPIVFLCIFLSKRFSLVHWPDHAHTHKLMKHFCYLYYTTRANFSWVSIKISFCLYLNPTHLSWLFPIVFYGFLIKLCSIHLWKISFIWAKQCSLKI